MPRLLIASSAQSLASEMQAVHVTRCFSRPWTVRGTGRDRERPSFTPLARPRQLRSLRDLATLSYRTPDISKLHPPFADDLQRSETQRQAW